MPTAERPHPVHDALTWRPLVPDDVDEWFALSQLIEQHDASNERTSRAEMVEQFENTALDPALDSIMGTDDDGIPRAYGWVETNPVARSHHQSLLWGGVHPQWRRRGIGSAILDWQLGRARQALATVADGSKLPQTLVVHAEEHHADRFALFAGAEFTVERWFMDMRRRLPVELPEPRPIASVEIMPFREELAESVREVHNESFADHWGSQPISAQRWAQYIRAESHRPEWSFVAVETSADRHGADPTIVGYTLAGAHEQDWAPQGHTEGWTEVLGVLRSHRGRGIAEQLVLASMRAFRDAGMEYAGLDVDTESPTGAYGLYERLGYEPQHRGAALTRPA